MGKVTLVVNSECPVRCFEYDENTLAAETRFREAKDTADIKDTLEVACPYLDCEIRDELYLKEFNDIRMVKFGIFGRTCLLNTLSGQRKL